MKYLSLSVLLSICIYSTQACDCNSFSTMCDVLDNSVLSTDYSKIACYVEYTGNSISNKYEVKIIDLYYGDIQPGSEPYLNTDSTFWVTSGWNSCQDIFTLKDGYHALMATSTYYGGIYDFFDCSYDLDIYLEPIEPAAYNELVQSIESCLTAHCDEDLILTDIHRYETVYQGLTISSAAEVNRDIVYKVIDQATLQNGFQVNENKNFSIEIGTCN